MLMLQKSGRRSIMEELILKTVGLRKDINKKNIVKDINLEIKPGEIFGFLGPNGAGKSTTIKMIVGLSKITEGDIFVCGYSVKKDFRDAMRNVGCIVENPELYKYMSGLDNLKLFAKLYPNIDEARINEVIDLVEMRYAIKNKVKTYSLGMKQRLGIAQALLNRPKLLILDEPTNGLDPAGIIAMRDLLTKLSHNENLSVLVSSHILGEMQQLCDRVAIINHGRIITTKTVDELLHLSKNQNPTVVFSTGDNNKAITILNEYNITMKLQGDGIHAEIQHDKIPDAIVSLVNASVPIFGVSAIEEQTLEEVFIEMTEEAV